MTVTLTAYADGTPCDLHELPHCGVCREQARMRRTSSGVQYDEDCTVSTFVELTGAEYAEAAEILAAHGFRPGHGAPSEALNEALRSVGYTVRPFTGPIGDAYRAALHDGRSFWVHGRKGRAAHAWTISDGVQRRAYRPPFRYYIWEVVG